MALTKELGKRVTGIDGLFAVRGYAGIRLHSRAQIDVSALDLDAGGLQIKSVGEGTAPQWFERNSGTLTGILAHPLHPGEQRTIDVLYEAGPAPGLKFFPDQIYTSITSHWMPCNDRPDQRAKFHLTIAGPPDTKAAGSGQPTATRAGEGQSVTEWQLDSAADPYFFGFALGRFTENIYNQLRAEGKDRSLSNADWPKRQEADSRISEHKGVWFLYLVNRLLGDKAFTEGLRLYMNGQWQQSATSDDLQRAFAAVSTGGGKKGSKPEHKNGRRDAQTHLDILFDMWVYGVVTTSPSK